MLPLYFDLILFVFYPDVNPKNSLFKINHKDSKDIYLQRLYNTSEIALE